MDGASVQIVGAEVHYRASALGSCTRALAAARQEMEGWDGPPPENIQKAYDAGNDREAEGIKWLEQNPANKIISQQLEVRLALTPTKIIVGHIDGFFAGQGTLLEVKRQNEEEFAKPSIRDSIWWGKYQYQFSAYILATDCQMMCLRGSDDGDWRIEMFTEPPLDRTALLRRVLEVEAMAAKDLLGEKCDKDDFPCPMFRQLHPSKEEKDGAIVEREEREDAELADLALHYARLAVDLEPLNELEKRRKDLKKKIEQKVGGGKKNAGVYAFHELVSGIEVVKRVSTTRERVTPPGTMVRVEVRLPDGQESAKAKEGDEGEARDG